MQPVLERAGPLKIDTSDLKYIDHEKPSLVNIHKIVLTRQSSYEPGVCLGLKRKIIWNLEYIRHPLWSKKTVKLKRARADAQAVALQKSVHMAIKLA